MYFRYLFYLPLEKGVVLHLNKLSRIPFTQGCFLPSLVEICPKVPEKRTPCEKFTTTTTTTDNGQISIIKAHLSLRLR